MEGRRLLGRNEYTLGAWGKVRQSWISGLARCSAVLSHAAMLERLVAPRAPTSIMLNACVVSADLPPTSGDTDFYANYLRRGGLVGTCGGEGGRDQLLTPLAARRCSSRFWCRRRM